MASSYLTRTPASATNRKTWTFSSWFKVSSGGRFLSSQTDASNIVDFSIGSDGAMNLSIYESASWKDLVPSMLFRDRSAWYHIVIACDTTQATASNRLKVYVNGSQVTSFSTEVYVSQNYDTAINNNVIHRIGAYINNGLTFDGSMSHIHFIDGTAYDADTFGETDSTTGIWKPKTTPSVTYGTNGFFLKGENSGALGTDSSGNANNFTVNGTPTQTIDTPSNVFCTGNPLYKYGYNLTLSNGNTSFAGTQNQWQGTNGTLAISKGKYYYEAKFTSATDKQHFNIGFMGAEDYNTSDATRNLVGFYNNDGGEIIVADATNTTATTANYGTFDNGDIMGVALDYDNELISFYKNGNALVTDFNYGASTYPSTLTDGKFISPVVATYASGSVSLNFGNGFFGTTAVASAGTSTSGDASIWEYDCPDGYYGLNTKNINAQEYS